MSAVEKKLFCVNEYKEYEPVIQCALKVFLQAKKQGRIKFFSKIDNIIGNLFAVNSSYAGKFRKLYFPTSRNQNNEALYIECLTKCKISHFNFRLMISECRKHNIYISDETYDGMLLLSTYALPVSEILKEKSNFEIHKQLRCEVEHWIEAIDEIMVRPFLSTMLSLN